MYTTFCSWNDDNYKGDTGLYLWKMSPDYNTYNQTERLISLTVTENGTAKKAYRTGESFDTSGITVQANYSDGKPSEEVQDFTVIPATFGEIGTYPVTISYTVGNVTVTGQTPFDVEVSAPVSVSVNTDGAKTEYRVGESFDKSTVTMEIVYSNGDREQTENFDVTPGAFVAEGEQQVSFSYSDGTDTFTAPETVTVNVSEALNFGDYVVGDGNEFTTVSVSGNSPIADVGTYTMGGVSHGDCVYVSMKSGNIAKIFQLDPNNGFEVKANKTITAAAELPDVLRLFVKDDTLYIILQSGTVYSKALGADGSEFASGEFESTTLPFTGTCAAWNEEKGRYAVLNGNNVYLRDENGDLVTGDGITNTFTPSGSGTISSLTADDKYIYVSFRSDGQTNIPIETYDWNGNHVASCAPNSASYPADGFNVQSLFEYNGSMYATVCSFGTAGYYMYVWAITPVA